ncbi:HAMP domain-containing protein [Myxococcota bacterium]|nr:HAMP domain-containing protein [Myxococcota bacterium]
MNEKIEENKPVAENKPDEFKKGISLRIKLTFGLILIIVIIFAALNIFNISSHNKARRAQALNNGETIARLVAGALTGELADNDLDSARIRGFLNNFLTAALTLNKKNKDLAYALIVDAKGKLISGKARADLTVFPGGTRLTDDKKVLLKVAQLEGRLGGYMRTKAFSLKVGTKGMVGKLLVGISLERVEKEVKADIAISMTVFVIAILILIFYASFTLGYMVINPVKLLANAMHQVHIGKLGPEVEVDIDRRDEIGELASTYNFMVKGLRERAHLEDAFNRYVSPQVYEKMHSGDISLAGERVTGTVLFSDIRSFTALSERQTPEEVVAMLNEYFTEMVDVVFKYEGFVNKFIGDAIMAVYNAPLQQENSELRAVRTGVEMLESLKKLNKLREFRGEFPIKIGIGINTGPLIAGNIGHLQRLEYTVIGDTVNLAQRTESQTKAAGHELLITESTYKAVAAWVKVIKLPPVKVKGKAEAVVLYAVKELLPDPLAHTLQKPKPENNT